MWEKILVFQLLVGCANLEQAQRVMMQLHGGMRVLLMTLVSILLKTVK